MNARIIFLSGRAPRALRDRFVTALEGDDYVALQALAIDLGSCTDILRRAACMALGLPRGSTYALAAKTVVAT